jgi:hypothetical protein
LHNGQQASSSPWSDWRDGKFHPQWSSRLSQIRKSLHHPFISGSLHQYSLSIHTDNQPQEVAELVRPSSAEKPEVKALSEKNVKVCIADITGPVEDVIPILSGFDAVISAVSAIDGTLQLSQMNLATAAKKAGIKRFVPCAFASVCPPGGVMMLRDEVRSRCTGDHSSDINEL